MNDQITTQTHALAVHNRESATVSGVTEVLNFDEEGIMLDTVMGILGIDGENLKITRLDLDRKEVDFEGKVNGLIYADRSRKKGLFRKK